MRLVATVALVTLLATSARARADLLIDPSEPEGLKSEGTALTLSIGVTSVSWGMVLLGKDHAVPGVIGAFGAYFGPSLAQLYVADRPHARGFLLRTAGVVGVVAGANAGLACSGTCESDWVSTSLYVAGALAIAAGTVDDIVRQPGLVRRHNRRIRELALVPMVSERTAGLTLGGRF